MPFKDVLVGKHKYTVSTISRRADGNCNQFEDWFVADLKLDANGDDAESHESFRWWFREHCEGYYRWPTTGIILFSDEEDKVRYYLGYY